MFIVSSSRNSYTMKEMKNILEYIKRKDAYSEVKGRRFWIEYANSGVWQFCYNLNVIVIIALHLLKALFKSKFHTTVVCHVWLYNVSCKFIIPVRNFECV